MKIAVLGLGKMGSRIALKLYEDSHEVLVWNRSEEAIGRFFEALKSLSDLNESSNASVPAELGIRPAKRDLAKTSSRQTAPRAFKTIEELISNLEAPRILWLMLPAGSATQNVLDEIQKYIQSGDIVIDGGNANSKDSEKRYEHFKNLGIEFLGIGVSGGILASENGFPLMVGGSKKAYEYIKPILDSLAKPHGGHAFFGEGGAGHFVKMVHNGIEYGVMQSLAEGFAVLEKSDYKFNLLQIAKLWQKGTLVSGFMLDRSVDALAQDPDLENMAGPVAESGEARWTIEEAKKTGVETEIIEKSLEYRVRSQKDENMQNSFTVKMLNALRSAFGGHKIK